jgi:NADPH:quinone reductase-like Zn-dependent oxidoreductase
VGAFPPASGPLNQIAALVNTGHIKPVVSSIFPIQEIQKAHELVDGAHNKGKLVLQVVN